MYLAEAVCCPLGRMMRSVHLRVIVTLGSFRVFLTFVLNVPRPAGATATMDLVFPIAHFPLSPAGWAGGASSVARAAAPPAAVAAVTRIAAGTLVTNCTGTRTSSRAIADMGRGGRPAGRATSSSTWRMELAVPCADLMPRKHDARLSALVVAVVDCFLAWAEASSPTGEEEGRGGGRRKEASGA